MKKITVVLLCMFFACLFFTSCEKTEDLTIDAEKITSIVTTIDLFNTDDVEELTTSQKKSLKCHCPEIIYHPNEDDAFWPLSITLDFGEEGCEFPQGVIRKGKIHTSLTDCWMHEGAVHSITFEDYFINEYNLLGTKTITNTGLNENENPTWEIQIVDGGIKDTLGNERYLNATLTKEIVEGADTWGFYDNVCEMTGNATGSDNGVEFSAEITVPLRYTFMCRFPVSGEIVVTIGSETITVNYGEGECDNTAIMQIGDNNPEEITLGFKCNMKD